MKEKMRRLTIPKRISLRTVLVHVNGVTDEVIESPFFDFIIDFSELIC